jgi:polysaccharide pyruvyl transferase WcaK-like protein
LWDLSREHSALIPQEKAENVVLTFTDYMPHEPSDRVLFDTLRRLYKRIYIWLQGPNDYAYSQRITDNDANVEYVDPAVSALDELIHSGTDIDYVGTRLHAGIRCLKAGRRTLVIAIDNRAAEISRETNLPTVSRQELDKLSKKVAENWETRLTLPIENIDRWKDQFARPRKPQLSK